MAALCWIISWRSSTHPQSTRTTSSSACFPQNLIWFCIWYWNRGKEIYDVVSCSMSVLHLNSQVSFPHPRALFCHKTSISYDFGFTLMCWRRNTFYIIPFLYCDSSESPASIWDRGKNVACVWTMIQMSKTSSFSKLLPSLSWKLRMLELEESWLNSYSFLGTAVF